MLLALLSDRPRPSAAALFCPGSGGLDLAKDWKRFELLRLGGAGFALGLPEPDVGRLTLALESAGRGGAAVLEVVCVGFMADVDGG